MQITNTFIGTKRTDIRYLFFLLTEDYIEAHQRLMADLEPHLHAFAERLDAGLLVRPFRGRVRDTQREVFQKPWIYGETEQLRKTPGLLIIDEDFDTFDPRKHPWLHINFRESMNDVGLVHIFEFQELLNSLADVTTSGENLFAFVAEIRSRERTKILLDGLDFKAEFLGISFDVRSGLKYLRALRDNFQSRRI